METLIVLITTSILSAIGWWIGEFVGLTTAFILSIVGTAIGAYIGRQIFREYFS
jgi:uncharacterized membrane protein YfcA